MKGTKFIKIRPRQGGFFSFCPKLSYFVEKKNFENFSTFFKKTIDKSKNYGIILKCIILAFYIRGFLPFFQGKFVELHKNTENRCGICTY